jgi:carboxypeptidase T
MSALMAVAGRVVLRLALTLPVADLPALRAAGYDVLAVDHDQGWVDVMAPTPELAGKLRSYAWRVLDEHPVDGAYRPDRQYKTPEAVAAILKDFVDRFPRLATLRSIGKSTEGRDIWAVKLTAATSYVDLVTKPAVLFNAMHHAREVMSTEVALDTIDYLLTGYGHDERVTGWLDADEIWVLPMLNVDGNDKVWTTDAMWRKNTRDGYGVDINRNYSFQWGKCGGSSGSRGADDYRGPAAGSEPETQAMMAFVREIRPVFDISYHSYGEYVIYPYGCDGQRTPGARVVEAIGKEMAARIPSDSGRGHYKPGTSWELLYAVDGSDIDWMYHDLQVLPYVIEVNSGFGGGGFQPDYDVRDATVESVRNGWTYLLDRLDGPGIRGRVADHLGRPHGGGSIRIGEALYDLKPDGSFHAVLDPGTYDVQVTVGARTLSRTVTVSTARRNVTFIL